MKEEWKPVKGFEHQYFISSKGRVLSLGNNQSRKDKILKPWKSKKGHLSVGLGGKRHYVHRLVATAFLPNPNHYKNVQHLNNVKDDNHLINLKWSSHRKIIRDCYEKKLVKRSFGEKKVVQLSKKGKPLQEFDSIKMAAKAVNGEKANIAKVCHGYRRTAYGYLWNFVED